MLHLQRLYAFASMLPKAYSTQFVRLVIRRYVCPSVCLWVRFTSAECMDIF